MFTKLVAFAAFVSVARGGFLAPQLAYSAAPLSVGAQHQSVLRSLDGDSSVSHYSKAVDSAFSSVRKYDTRITNDAKFFAPAAVTYAAAAPLVRAAPAISYAAPASIAVRAAPAYTYAAPASIAVKAAPAYGYHSYAPGASYVAHTTFTGLGAHYAF